MSLILVDGSALIYRAHYAFANRPLTAPSGEITSVTIRSPVGRSASARIRGTYSPRPWKV